MSDDFLSRWSRRKRTVQEAAAEAMTAPPQPDEDAAVEEMPPESDEELLARLGLRHPDEMAPGDDFAGFLRAAVPQHLKTLAWRRLWRSNPTLACLDGLNDYDGDFTGSGVPAGGLRTSYEVGRGILRRVAEAAEEAPRLEPDPPRAPEDEAAEPAQAEADAPPAAVAEPEPAEPEVRAARRRMVFRSAGRAAEG